MTGPQATRASSRRRSATPQMAARQPAIWDQGPEAVAEHFRRRVLDAYLSAMGMPEADLSPLVPDRAEERRTATALRTLGALRETGTEPRAEADR